MSILKDVDIFLSSRELWFWSQFCHKFLTLSQTLITFIASAVFEGTKQQCFCCTGLCHKPHLRLSVHFPQTGIATLLSGIYP